MFLWLTDLHGKHNQMREFRSLTTVVCTCCVVFLRVVACVWRAVCCVACCVQGCVYSTVFVVAVCRWLSVCVCLCLCLSVSAQQEQTSCGLSGKSSHDAHSQHKRTQISRGTKDEKLA